MTVTGHCADIAVETLLGGLRFGHAALGHALALDDEVDHHADERQAEKEQRPTRLAPPGGVVPAEEVGEDREQQPDPDDPGEEHEHRPQRIRQWITAAGLEHDASLANVAI